jgi:hypothetical protein
MPVTARSMEAAGLRNCTWAGNTLAGPGLASELGTVRLQLWGTNTQEAATASHAHRHGEPRPPPRRATPTATASHAHRHGDSEPRWPPRRAKPAASAAAAEDNCHLRDRPRRHGATDLARRDVPAASGGRRRQGGAGHAPPCRIVIVCARLHARLNSRKAKPAARHGGAVTDMASRDHPWGDSDASPALPPPPP